MYVIEKDVPYPEGRHLKVPKYPLRDMAIGDSFFVPGTLAETLKSYRALHARAKQIGLRVSLRRTPDGLRCWRIK